MPMIFACGLNHHIDSTTQIPTQFLDNINNKFNPTYSVWLREDQLVLNWIIVSVSQSILPQLVGAMAARAAWDKLVVTYASGSKPYIRELKSQLHTLRRDNVSIESYVQKAKGIADNIPPMMPQSSVPTPTSNQPSPSPFSKSLTNPRFLLSVDPITGHTHATDPPSQDDVSHGVALLSPSVVAENPHSSNTSH
ncbi:hypothetical protein H5410_017051 [Solanum commersonii]|uniref:Uncharacterized protein n=1 Tax=Solanum commersonii TaxID=4109 RepID=A0A9J5ZYT6_SOLCO|nr:hypothetical protein H5410_017051 [Solanum commersonii]